MKRLIPILLLWLSGCEAVDSSGGPLPPIQAVGASVDGADPSRGGRGAERRTNTSAEAEAARGEEGAGEAASTTPDPSTDVASVFDVGSIPVDPPQTTTDNADGEAEDAPGAPNDDDGAWPADPSHDDNAQAEHEDAWLARPSDAARRSRPGDGYPGGRAAWTADAPVHGWGVRLLSIVPHSQPPRAVLGLPDGRELVVSPGTMVPEAQIVVLAIGRDAMQIAEVLPDGDRAVIRSQMLSPLYGAQRGDSAR